MNPAPPVISTDCDKSRRLPFVNGSGRSYRGPPSRQRHSGFRSWPAGPARCAGCLIAEILYGTHTDYRWRLCSAGQGFSTAQRIARPRSPAPVCQRDKLHHRHRDRGPQETVEGPLGKSAEIREGRAQLVFARAIPLENAVQRGPIQRLIVCSSQSVAWTVEIQSAPPSPCTHPEYAGAADRE